VNAELMVGRDPAIAERISKYVRAFIGVKRISVLVGIPVKKLEAMYPFELGYTDDEELACVADIAYQMASSGRYPDMTKWWLKVKGGARFNENIIDIDSEASPMVLVFGDAGGDLRDDAIEGELSEERDLESDALEEVNYIQERKEDDF